LSISKSETEPFMGEMDDVVKEFLVESYENLDRLDRDFVALETDPAASDRIGSIFRTIHTIKGTCGFLGFSKLESVAHVGENLLCKLRDRELMIDAEITNGLLKLVDSVREILGFIETTQSEGDGDYSRVVNTLRELNDRSAGNQVTQPADSLAAPVDAGTSEEAGAAEVEAVPASVSARADAPAVVTPSTPPGKEAEHAPEAHMEAPVEGQPSKEAVTSSMAGNAIRVDVVLLDKLMNLVGELVLARNQVLQFTSGQTDTGLINTTQRLNLITSELQESVMKTRMQPIGGLWNKFPRIVRDLAQSCHKKVRIEMEGRETELDKTIIEAIKDPLTHIIRNSVDHGVEGPEARLAKGKNEEGCLFLRAYHEGGQVNIEIRDDGNGIDADRVKRKAVEKGLITIEQAARMSEREAVGLIFLPGFSTAEKVTNVSGRGVGMDVVKTNVENIGGTVDVQSKLGEGTTLRIKIPLTLAIIPALVVTSAGERFVIPQASLLELVRLEANDEKIESIHGAAIYRLRGRLLPLVYLSRILKIQGADGGGEIAGRSENLVVLRAGERQFGLVVDQVNDTEEIVVKPLGKQLKGINVFAGATIMGDGRVALILDVVGLAQKANILSQVGSHGVKQTSENAKVAINDRQTLLLFMLRGGRRMAIPLSMVSRLEEFARKSIETAGSQPVVQYRGQIMPLINLAEVVGNAHNVTRTSVRRPKPKGASIENEMIQVVVISHENRNIGLRVERILDVVEEQVHTQLAGSRPGVQGTAVIKEQVTELIDLGAVVEMAFDKHSSVRAALAA
jgi:two-component system chemotaxis sensor kinase CheA